MGGEKESCLKIFYIICKEKEFNAVRMKNFLLICFLACSFVFLGCTGTQISSLYTYNGKIKQRTFECLVVRTSIEPQFNDLFNQHKKNFMGDAKVEYKQRYTNNEVAYDCMEIGAKTAVVYDRGVVPSSAMEIPVTYITGDRQAQHFEYSPNEEVHNYLIAFFKKELPIQGSRVTYEKISAWRESNRIDKCVGCKKFKKTE